MLEVASSHYYKHCFSLGQVRPRIENSTQAQPHAEYYEKVEWNKAAQESKICSFILKGYRVGEADLIGGADWNNAWVSE